MSQIEQANAFLELKQKTNRDVRQLGPLVTQSYEAESTLGQSTINLSFAVEQTATAKKQVLLFVDGKMLREGSGNDYTYINSLNGQSSQIQLAVPLTAGLNIVAYRIGAAIQNFISPATVQATLNTDVAQPNPMAKAGFQNFIAPVYTTAPNTQILNRAQVLDASATLASIAGVERIFSKNIILVPDEFGPNGERVWEPNTKDNRVRFVGAWANLSDDYASRTISGLSGDFVEVTFYGTGLDLIHVINTAARDIRVTIDGGAESANIYTAGSTTLNARGYAINNVQNVTSGLSLGWHTVKIRDAGGAARINLYGFQILNERSDLAVLPGTAYCGTEQEILAAMSTSAFNAGVVGTRGARVVKYIKDGVISQSVTEVNASTSFLGSADHTNEEILRKINFREFGANRADDFSTLAAVTSDRAFTLDDGTTTMTGDNVRGSDPLGFGDSLYIPAAGATTDFFGITFVGTGLDIIAQTDGVSTRNLEIYVNNVSVGTVAGNSFPTGITKFKVVSGLPYGTHTVRFEQNNTAVNSWTVSDFIVYQPSKPAIPVDAVEVCDYNVLADYNHATAVGTTLLDQYQVPTGVLTKPAMREWIYTGTFTPSIVPQYLAGFQMNFDALSNKAKLTFFGTGVQLHFSGTTNAATVNIRIDGALNATGVNRLDMVNNGGGLYTLNAGSTIPKRVDFSGLSMGVHTVEIELVTQTGIDIVAAHIMTPIHIVNPSLKEGSTSLLPNRNFTPVKSTVNEQIDLSKAKAWLHYSSANQQIISSYNISAVLLPSTGNHQIFFEKPFKNDKYVCVGSHSGTGTTTMQIGTPLSSTIFMRNNSIVVITQVSGANTNPNAMYLAFYGELIDE